MAVVFLGYVSKKLAINEDKITDTINKDRRHFKPSTFVKFYLQTLSPEALKLN